MATIEEVYRDVEERMAKSLQAFKQEILKIRTGRATPALLEGIKVEYYGSQIPLQQIASISVVSARLLRVQPWDKTAIGEIDRAIRTAGLGLNPQIDGDTIRVPIPPLSDERRQDLVKLVHKLAEDARVAIRNIRRDGIEQIRKMEKNHEISEDDSKRAQEKIQKIHDKYIKEINEAAQKKEKEILEE